MWEPRDRCTPEQVIQRTQSRFIDIQSTFLELLQSQHLLFDSCWFLTMFKIVVSLWGVSMYRKVFVFKEDDGDLNVRSCVFVDVMLPFALLLLLVSCLTRGIELALESEF